MKKFLAGLTLAILMIAALVIPLGQAKALTAAELTTIKVEEGYVLSDKYQSKVILKGKQEQDSPYFTDIQIEVLDKAGKTALTIKPAVNSGYGADITLLDFGVNQGMQQIYYAASSGGSGGFGYFYVYSVKDGKLKTLFDFEKFSAENQFKGRYIDGYKVEIQNLKSGERYIIDLSLRPQEYKNEIWKKDGKLIKPRDVDISGTNTVFPYYNFFGRNYQLMIYQRITGLYGADTLGYVITQQTYEKGAFETYFQGVEIFGNQ